jgi:hypothetical protein
MMMLWATSRPGYAVASRGGSGDRATHVEHRRARY